MSVSRRRRWLVLERDGFTCRYCGRSAPNVELEVDHVHPVAAGGSDDPDNLVTACYDCNRGKTDYDGSGGLDVAWRLARYEIEVDSLTQKLWDACAELEPIWWRESETQ